ncbi:MAG TPA: trypsin-like peptidase domain-containing protein, partial [Blastocatellia bacterium]|nr:trypsin-like peptidase domain-containing protein [Blastocatellia bacterium]
MSITFTHLTGPKKGQRETFGSEPVSIGRAPDNSLRFEDHERRVSAHHAEVRRKGRAFILRDLGSTNGTMINGRRVVVSEVRDDDMVEVGAGGPLLRFNLDLDDTIALAPTAPDHGVERRAASSGAAPEPRARERPIEKAVHTRSTNLPLILALLVALLIGALGGIWLYSRAGGPGGGRLSFREVAERSGPAVVYIRAEFEIIDATGQVRSSYSRSGSGFVMSPGTRIITNRHLVRDWEYAPPPPGTVGRTAKITVILPGYRKDEAMEAQIAQLSPAEGIDVAVLEIKPPYQIPLPQGIAAAGEQVSQGEDVAVIGYPLGLDLLQLTREDRIENSFTTGVVSRVNDDVIQLSLRAYRGNSGGPVLNRRGEAVGILTSNVEFAQDITFCTPIAAVMR